MWQRIYILSVLIRLICCTGLCLASGQLHCQAAPQATGRQCFRVVRKAAVGTQAQEHLQQLFHMHRRIDDQLSETERFKNEWDVSLHPVWRKTSAGIEPDKGASPRRSPSRK